MPCGNDDTPRLMGDHPAARGIAALRRGDAAAALAHFDELVRLEPGGVPGHFLRAEAIEKSGDLGLARETLRTLAMRFPFAEGACRERLALLAMREGDRDGALEELRLAVEHGWNSAEAVTSDPSFARFEGDPAFAPLLEAARRNDGAADTSPDSPDDSSGR